MIQSYDVFLSHNSRDKLAVRKLALALRSRGLRVWLDEWELVPGRPWQEALEEIIETTRSAAVLVGKDGPGPWQDAEMRGCLSEFVKRQLPVIPVLLPGVPEAPKLPLFLTQFTWVDLRGGLTEEGIDRLQWGITGKKPDRPTYVTPPKSIASSRRTPTDAVPPTAGAPVLVEPGPVRGLSSPYEARREARRAGKPQGTREPAIGWKQIGWGLGALLVVLLVGLVALDLPSLQSALSLPEPDGLVPGRVQPAQPSSTLEAPLDPVRAEPSDALARTRSDSSCVPGELRTENGIDFVRICAGVFTMGSSESDPQAALDEKPAHEVILSEFWIGKTEITNEQFRRYYPHQPGEDRLPAAGVSWFDAKAVCGYLGGRLPTEAEWEYAARAGSRTAWSFGDEEQRLGDYAWYDKNSGGTLHPVGMKKANRWGLYDMHGNAWEWVADWYALYKSSPQKDPEGPKLGESRVLRGGFFAYPARVLRSAFRVGRRPETQDGVIGFRCAISASQQP